MRTLPYFILAVLALGSSASGAQPPAEVARLIAQLEPLNDACRGGSGDDPATTKACAQRDRKFSQIVKAGWCLGPDSAPSYQKTWMPCPSSALGPAKTSEAACPMFKGPTAVVCHDRATAVTAYERYGFDVVALSAPHMPAYLRKFGCSTVDTRTANQSRWVSDASLDQRTARETGWISVGFVQRAGSDPNVAAWAVATEYLNKSCRVPS